MNDILVEPTLSGVITSGEQLLGTISEEKSLKGLLTIPEGSEYDVYEGPNNIIPKLFTKQTLETANKVVKEDITISKVPYFETGNDSGKTVYIGGEVELNGGNKD